MTNTRLPATILIIRHGEKPDNNSDLHLSDAGRARADMLAKTMPAIYPNLSVLFATAQSTNSNRPYETIVPLATAMRLVVNNSFSTSQHSELAELVRSSEDYGGKTILICWHHEKIPVLVRDDFGQEGAPTFWSNDVFDQIWQIDYSSDGQSTFTIKPEPPMPT